MKLQLGDVTFDDEARQLRRGTMELHLSPKAFDLLKALIEVRPRALSKQELQDRLWPSTFVSEANLPSLVAEVRQALGDTPQHPKFVRTAHRFGYAFCADLGDTPDAPVRPAATTLMWLINDGRRLPLRLGENILGRDEDGIMLDSPTVSRRHARILIGETDAVLEDLGSKNGTFHRGDSIKAPVALSDGDEIRVGAVVLRFRRKSPKNLTATWSQ